MHPDGMASDHTSAPAKRRMTRLLFLIPLAAFLALAVVFDWGLGGDPRLLPSPLIGKPVPRFVLPPVKGRTPGLTSTDLVGQVSIVNVFASWCVECRLEHPLLMHLKEAGGFPIYGIDYKDRPRDAEQWLATMGDPYTRTGADLDGRVGLNWGVYGVPETFVISPDGRIAYKHVGPLTPEALRKTLLPLIQRLKNEAPAKRVAVGGASAATQ